MDLSAEQRKITTCAIRKNVKIDASLNLKRKYLSDINFNATSFEILISLSLASCERHDLHYS